MTPTQRSIDPTSRIEPVSPDQLTDVTGGGGLLGKLFGGKSGTLGFAGNLLSMFGGTGTGTASAPSATTATNLMRMFKSFAGAATKPSAKPSASPEPSNRTASTETTGEGSSESA
jgi:hypothetical protein